MEDITENECCGSGCTNCVLDRYIKTPKNKIEGCDNIFNGNYTKFKVIHIEQRTENVFEFKFEWNCDMKFEKPCILDVAGGSHLMLRASHSSSSRKFNSIFNNYRNSIVNTPKNMEYQRKFIEKHDTTEDDLYFSRPYTPILISNEPPQFTVLIKLEPFGLMSNYLQTLQIGDLTEWKGVFNKIPSNIKKAFYNIICICHGVSIAPFYTLSKELIEDDEFEANITLYACFKDIGNILLRDQLINLNRYWNFQSTIFLSRQEHEEGCREINGEGCCCTKKLEKFSEKIKIGRINDDSLEKIVENIPEKTDALISGSESFTIPIQTFLKENFKFMEIHIL